MSRPDKPAAATAPRRRWDKHTLIAVGSLIAIALHLLLRFQSHDAADWPLYAALALGGLPLVIDLIGDLFRRQFGSDLLAGISIVTSVILGEYLAGTLVVLMLSGGGALERYAVAGASSVLEALAKRMPSTAHVRSGSKLTDTPLDEVNIDDVLVVFPHETCPVDGVVIEGHGVMDESYLTGEPYMMSKTPGASVLSGAINGETALTIRAQRRAVDSRYARIMEVMAASQQQRPRLRRLGDSLGAIYTPVAVAFALVAWALSGDPVRFLAVLVVATPCPLLIAIPVAVIGSISLAARRSIIIRDPAVLENVDLCTTVILDKTGTLTYGRPRLVEIRTAPGSDADDVLALVAGLERYSRHPLAEAIVEAADERRLARFDATEVSEKPGEGLRGIVNGRSVRVTSRTKLIAAGHPDAETIPAHAGGLECVILIEDRYAATCQFRDSPRREGQSFVSHLAPAHNVSRVLLVSGDRESEVAYLAEQVGISEVYAQQSPEQKVEITRAETAKSPTMFIGDGVNDAPALLTATVGIAMGTQSDVTVEAAGAVILEASLKRVDELMHIGRRMRRIALQSAVGGMALSILGMGAAAAGYLPPVAGALAQEVIDVFAILNALRAAFPPRSLSDF